MELFVGIITGMGVVSVVFMVTVFLYALYVELGGKECF